MSDRLEQIKTQRSIYGRVEDMDGEVAALVEDQEWLVAEVERLRPLEAAREAEGLRRYRVTFAVEVEALGPAAATEVATIEVALGSYEVDQVEEIQKGGAERGPLPNGEWCPPGLQAVGTLHDHALCEQRWNA